MALDSGDGDLEEPLLLADELDREDDTEARDDGRPVLLLPCLE